MTACGPFFSDMVYFGTSGWSPALGGILNPANCSGPNTNNRVTRCAPGGDQGGGGGGAGCSAPSLPPYHTCSTLDAACWAPRAEQSVSLTSHTTCEWCAMTAAIALSGSSTPPRALWPMWPAASCRVGDVCVSPWSVDWVCKKSSWSSQAAGWPNQCFRPNESQGPNATYLYGECQFYADNVRRRPPARGVPAQVAGRGAGRGRMTDAVDSPPPAGGACVHARRCCACSQAPPALVDVLPSA